MWYLNDIFLVMTPDLCHPKLGWIVEIYHQENPGHFMEVESYLKGGLSLHKDTDMHAN